MADDLRKYTTQEVLNKVYTDSSGNSIGINSSTTKETLNAVFSTSDNSLNVALSGGSISGDVTISGDLTVVGSATNTYDEQIQGIVQIVGATGTGATPAGTLQLTTSDTTIGDDDQLGRIEFLAASEADGSDSQLVGASIVGEAEATFAADNNSTALVFSTNTSAAATERMRISSSGNVGIGNTPEVNFHIKLADTANARIEDTSTDGIAKLDFKNDQRTATIGVYGDDSDKFKIDHGGGTVITIDTGQHVTFAGSQNIYSDGNVSLAATKQLFFDGGTHTRIEESSDDNLDFYAGSTRGMRLSGVNATFSGDLKVTKASGSSTISFVPANGQASQIKFMQDDNSTQDARIFSPEGAEDLAFEAGTTEMMRMTTTGVGIGVTPDSGWLSTRTALQIGGSGAIFGATSAGENGDLTIAQNVYFHSGGSYRRIDEDEASMYQQRHGVHNFYSAVTSTDNSTITFTDIAKFDINSRISLSNNDSGTQNTVFGHSAGLNIDAGTNYNTFIGYVSAGGATLDDAINNTAVGYATLNALTTGDGNVAVGTNAGLLIDAGEANICIGNRAGDGFDAENYNIFIGEDAGGGAINGADKCIAIGKAALDGAITTDGTIAIGHDALGALTSGSGCTAVGFESIDANDEGLGLTAFGYQSLSAQTGATNGATAIGHRALHSNNYNGTNDYSVAIGFESGDNQTSGFKNTFLGASTTGNDATAENQTVVGYHAQGQADNSVTLGNADVTAVYMAEDSGAVVHASGLKFDTDQTNNIDEANTLDDYEEGTYTATATPSSSGTITLNGTNNKLAYTKIGRVVHVIGEIRVSSVSSPVGNVAINLPFTPADLTGLSARSGGQVWMNAVASANVSDFVYVIIEDSANLFIYLGDATTVQSDSAPEIQANTEITLDFSYFTT